MKNKVHISTFHLWDGKVWLKLSKEQNQQNFVFCAFGNCSFSCYERCV